MIISSGLVIIRNNKILLVKPKGLDSGFYSIPKGIVEKEESILSAAIRETLEETGLLVPKEIINKTPHVCNYVSSNGNISKRVYYFVVNIDNVKIEKKGPIDFSEIDGYDYYDRSEAENLIYWKMMSVLNHIDHSKFSIKELHILESLNVIKRVKHPLYPFFLYNYTDKCKRTQFWNDTTLWCRGLVLDINGYVIARPFKKFFEEHQLYKESYPIKKENIIYEKKDGALGLLFFYKNNPIFCNRQSFKSRQSIIASEILYSKYSKHLSTIIKSNRTYLFEIIYPDNRFVVNYGVESDLFLLDVKENHTGNSLIKNDVFSEPKRMNNYNAFDRKNEGVVLLFENGFKLKIKNNFYKKRYLEIRKIKSGIAKNIEYFGIENNRDNWNLDYYLVYKMYLKKYLQIYLNYYQNNKNESPENIFNKVNSRNAFPG